MENVICHLSPRCLVGGDGPYFTCLIGGQLCNGDCNGTRKYTDQSRREGLMQNKTSSALFCMAKMPRFLKRTKLHLLNVCWRFQLQKEHYSIFATIHIWDAWCRPTLQSCKEYARHIFLNGVPELRFCFQRISQRRRITSATKNLYPPSKQKPSQNVDVYLSGCCA